MRIDAAPAPRRSVQEGSRSTRARLVPLPVLLLPLLPLAPCAGPGAEAGQPQRPGPDGFVVTETEDEIDIEGEALAAAIRKRGYVSGVKGGSLLDKRTGFRDLGHGLDIVDWIMEPGSDAAYRDRLPADLVYNSGNLYHGARPKRSIEGPQICTKARELRPRIVRGTDFVAVELKWNYTIAAPGRNTGSEWRQWLVFPRGKRYFLSSDRITSRNDSPALFLRIDMPGHIKHRKGDTFAGIYLSYRGHIPSREFLEDFPPDAKFSYRRDRDGVPDRFIRAYRVRDPGTGREGPWLAGMTLDPAAPSEAWCHQRGYVCMIHEFGERPVRAGESFSAAFLVGWFDSIEEMHDAYDRFKGAVDLEVAPGGWRLIHGAGRRIGD